MHRNTQLFRCFRYREWVSCDIHDTIKELATRAQMNKNLESLVHQTVGVIQVFMRAEFALSLLDVRQY